MISNLMFSSFSRNYFSALYELTFKNSVVVVLKLDNKKTMNPGIGYGSNSSFACRKIMFFLLQPYTLKLFVKTGTFVVLPLSKR